MQHDVVAAIYLQSQERLLHQIVDIMRRAAPALEQPAQLSEQYANFGHGLLMTWVVGVRNSWEATQKRQ